MATSISHSLSCSTRKRSDAHLEDSYPRFPKKVRQSPRFSEISSDIIELVLNRLPFLDRIRAKSVCSSWNSILSHQTAVPWLMLPSNPKGQAQERDFVSDNGCSFLHLGENRVYNLKSMPEKINLSCCIGSSHGWAIFLGQKLEVFMINPFTKSEIQFPSLDNSLGIINLARNNSCDGPLFEYAINWRRLSCSFEHYRVNQEIRHNLITKAILFEQDFEVAVIYGFRSYVGYCKGKDGKWIDLEGENPGYCDIICHKDHLFALSVSGSIESWNLTGDYPTKMTEISTDFPEKSLALAADFSVRMYLVESGGDILLVLRFISEFVDENDQLVDEPEIGQICPYKTLSFHVFRLECDKWVEVKSLGDHAIFVGGNHSVSVEVGDQRGCFCRPNSIYFTDDDWERMEEDYLYGGHDMGVFCLEDQKVKPFYDFGSDMKILPPPFWITQIHF